MTKNGKRELLGAIRPRYLRASATEKTHILDEFGDHRIPPQICYSLVETRKPQRKKKRGR